MGLGWIEDGRLTLSNAPSSETSSTSTKETLLLMDSSIAVLILAPFASDLTVTTTKNLFPNEFVSY